VHSFNHLGGYLWLNQRPRKWVSEDTATVSMVCFHKQLPGYAVTPFHELGEAPRRVGASRIFIKDESNRFGLPAFKILGASYGVYRAACERLGVDAEWDTLARLLAQREPAQRMRLLTATAGNHGRAVARVGRWLGLDSVVALPAETSTATVDAIVAEGAEVRMVNSSYDAAVEMVRQLANKDQRFVLVQDTAWSGYEQVPQWIVEGYATLFDEIDGQIAAAVPKSCYIVAVPVGVGSLLSAAIRHYRTPGRIGRTRVLCVEAETAACVLASVRAGEPVSVPTSTTFMQAINAGTMSATAWPLVREGLDAAVAVSDAQAMAAHKLLNESGVTAGPAGAAALAGAMHTLLGGEGENVCATLGLPGTSDVVVVSTDGELTDSGGGSA